ncbi:MAG: 5'-methylthioadenosine/S-adenosylhomocysteine nucleosidase [Acidobacteriota bacterium]
MRILIITPMQEEFDFFLQSCTKRGFHTEESMTGRLPVVRLPDLSVTLARGGTGKAQFAVQTQHLLDTCRDWDLVICAGAAGALVDDLSVGDIVVATTTVEHDYDNKFNQRPVPRFAGAQTAIADLKRASLLSNSFKVQFGTIASGDEDVTATERRRTLHQSTGALAVAWEGAGGARACTFSKVPFVEIRAVTDTANHNAASDFEANLEVAMNNIATLITSWISRAQQKGEGL